MFMMHLKSTAENANDLVKRAVIRFFFDGARGRGFCATKSVISPIDSDCSYGEKLSNGFPKNPSFAGAKSNSEFYRWKIAFSLLI
jgi:hypothetical protein